MARETPLVSAIVARARRVLGEVVVISRTLSVWEEHEDDDTPIEEIDLPGGRSDSEASAAVTTTPPLDE